MEIVTAAGVVLVATAAGTLGAMVGLGGGVILVPVLSAFFGIPLKTAIAASAVSVIVNALAASAVYLRAGMVNLRLSQVLLLATTIGAVAGGLLVVAVPASTLRVLFGLTLLGLTAVVLRRPAAGVPLASVPDRLGLAASYHDPQLGVTVRYVPRRIGIGLGSSAVAGLLSGLLGIGGGALQVPVMRAVMGVPLRAAAATSVLMVGITVAASSSIYVAHGLVDPSVAVPLAAGALAGAQAGARLSRRVSTTLLARLLAAVLLYLALTLLLQAAGIPLPGTRR